MITAVDTNVLIDVLEPDPEHGPASRDALKLCLREGSLAACEVVWAEVATAYGPDVDKVSDVLKRLGIDFSTMNREAALEAAKCWHEYRRKSRKRDRIVADFLIGGHAQVQCDRLLTRDRGFYKKYFRSLKLVTPGGKV